MIKGQQVFTEHFLDFSDCYVIIGGLAVDLYMEEQGIPFRVTKDFDIILILEALDPNFFEHFWKFIKEGNYERKEVGGGQRKYYRFIKPENEDYPYQIELFSRKPDVIPEIEGHHLIPIPADDDISSLSAILMDDDYYNLTKGNTTIIEGLHIATEPLLICLKIKAFIEMTQRKEAGEKIDSQNIRKHQNDVFRLATILTGSETMRVSASIMEDLQVFYMMIEKNPPSIEALLKNMGIGTSIALDDIMDTLKAIFITD